MEFKDRFAVNPPKPSDTQIGEHQIDVLPTARPVKVKRFRMSPQQEEEVNRQAEEMIRNGIARPSSSPWGSNLILVKKREGSTRFEIDYCQLSLLMEFKDRFAVNPKKPSVTQIGEHQSDVLPTARPVKAKRFRKCSPAGRGGESSGRGNDKEWYRSSILITMGKQSHSGKKARRKHKICD